MTAREALRLAGEAIDHRDAELLLRHVTGRDRAWMLAHPEAEVGAGPLQEFQSLVRRRQRNEPVQYLTGRQEFYGLDLRVTPETLIPRPETELLVEAVLGWCREQPDAAQARLRMADVGTGTGAIAIALAAHLPGAEIWALDLSPATRPVVEGNAARHGVSDRVHFVESDLLNGLAAMLERGLRLDAIVSNPPYVSTGDAEELEPQVRDYEPHLALFAGEDGLEIYRRLIPQGGHALRPGGLLAMEFGYGQRAALAEMLTRWKDVRFGSDLADIPRWVLAEAGFLKPTVCEEP